VIYAAETGQPPLSGEEMNSQLGAPRHECVTDKSGDVDIIMTDNHDSHQAGHYR
jgi:hypothetical protein